MKESSHKKKERVPVFGSRREEAEFWDTHSPLDFPGYWEDTEVEVEKPLRHEVILSVRLDEETAMKMEDLAKRRHIGKSTLARMFILEGLEKFSNGS